MEADPGPRLNWCTASTAAAKKPAERTMSSELNGESCLVWCMQPKPSLFSIIPVPYHDRVGGQRVKIHEDKKVYT